MKGVRIPRWLETPIERYQAEASHMFLLHGNVRDLQPFGPDYVPLVEGLRRLTARRAVVVTYDVSAGLVFPDAERQKAARHALGLRSALPADPARAMLVLDALVRSERLPPGAVALVLDFAQTLAPSGPSSPAERQCITTLARWAADPAVAARRPFITLIAPNPSEVSDEVYTGSAGAELVAIPRPDLEEREGYIVHLGETMLGTRFELPPAELARETGGLNLTQIEDIVQRARSAGTPLGRELVAERKVDLLRQEYGDVLEIIEPRHDLSAVGGLDHAVVELREVASLMRRGQSTAVPMGIALIGPPGTGKSYLSECFAKECGMLAVRTRPLRQMYVGQSERNQQRAFEAIRALAPVIVIVDESDQAEGGSRDQGSGDSGVSERMRAAAFNFWGDGSLRGRVLRIDITNRVDLIDAAMRRSGRTDVKIPILMPDQEARAQIFAVSVKKHRLACEVTDFAWAAKRTPGYTGSDIELAVTTAWRFALSAGLTTLTTASLERALDDLLPQARDQQTVDRMTLLALDECRNRRLLPRNHEAIRQEIEARRRA